MISLERAKEVGVRKVAGAQRGQLVRQFLGESGVAVMTAATPALVITLLMSSMFTSVSGKQISFNNENDLWVIGTAAVLLLMATAIVSSLYPASILSSYNPVKAPSQPKRRSTAAETFFEKS